MVILLGFLSMGQGACAATADEKSPVDFAADTVEHDETGEILTAMGNVELVQSGRIVKADKIIYNLKNDAVVASGNVVMNEPTGDTYFGDEVKLSEKMSRSFIQDLKGILIDGARITAVDGERVAGKYTTLRQASYTPCKPCKANPEKPPLWQLVADKVTHHEDEKRISYKNARFELMGVPIAYTPYFSHPDGTEKQKSGFLTPAIGLDSQKGANYQQNYYWAIAPDKDATVGAIIMEKNAPVLLGEYRQRFDNAKVEVEGSTTYSTRTNKVAGQNQDVAEEVRGHLSGNAQWDMNDKWRSGAKVNVTSDKQYLRQYDLDNEDVLENEIYAERFEGRDYTVVRALSFQDVRTSQRNVDQPSVVPEVKANFVGKPNNTLGGRWDAEISTLGLYRDGSGQDMARGSVKIGWERKFTSGFGLVSVANVLSRADLYSVTDRDVSVAGASSDANATTARGFVQGNVMTSYPLVNSFEDMQWVVEPLVAVTLASDVNEEGKIPNEDSQDVYLDALKIFNPNRFPGHDRVEDRSRVTYGMRTGFYGYKGNKGEIFLGQSYRFDDNGTPFPAGSGLSEQKSDYVGMITSSIGSYLDLDYRFQVDSDALRSRRHEVGALITAGPLSLYNQYFYAGSLAGTDLNETREQLLTSAQLMVADNWAVHGSTRYDLGEDEGLREASYGLSYLGQCMTVSLTGQRTLTDGSSGDSGTEILLRLGLKNLGEFQTSGVSLGGTTNE
jgi:LPS-assembly protein